MISGNMELSKLLIIFRKQEKVKTILSILLFSISLFSEEMIITNSSVNTLKKEDVKNIYLGYKRMWNNNQIIELTSISDGPIAESFMKKYLNKRNSQCLIYWKQLMFTGRGMMPKRFKTEAELIQYIAKTKGTIGYVSEEYKDSLPDNVNIIQIK